MSGKYLYQFLGRCPQCNFPALMTLQPRTDQAGIRGRVWAGACTSTTEKHVVTVFCEPAESVEGALEEAEKGSQGAPVDLNRALAAGANSARNE